MGEGDLKELRELVEFLKASGVAEFDMERPELKVHLTFGSTTAAPAAAGSVELAQLARLMAAGSAMAAPVGVVPAEVAPVQAATATPEAVTAAASVTASGNEEAGLHIVKSPLVGTFYDAASPGAEPFLKIGDKVALGKVMCIVEAMKIMNEIECDGAGEVVKMFVKPGQPVEYGQKLFGIRP